MRGRVQLPVVGRHLLPLLGTAGAAELRTERVVSDELRAWNREQSLGLLRP